MGCLGYMFEYGLICWGDCDGIDCPGSDLISFTPSALMSFVGMP